MSETTAQRDERTDGGGGEPTPRGRRGWRAWSRRRAGGRGRRPTSRGRTGRGWRAWSRRRRITLVVLAALVTLLTWNTVAVRTETAGASGERTVRLPGGDLNVVREGPTDAPTVVLLHGLAGSTAWWEPVLPALRDLDVVRVDLLGHGRSAKPGGGYGIEEQARRVAAVLDHLGVRHATLVGHSTGGAVATSLAEQRSDLVTSIALVDTGPRVDAFRGESFAARLMTTPVVGELLWRLRTDGVIRDALSTAFTRDVEVPDQLVSDVRAMTYRSLNEADAASSAYLEERNIPDRLADLDLPTLVLFGSEDQRWQPSSAQDYRRVPGARIEILDGVGHTPMFEDPETTGALLHDFAAAHADTADAADTDAADAADTDTADTDADAGGDSGTGAGTDADAGTDTEAAR